jgi:hypothetical protein
MMPTNILPEVPATVVAWATNQIRRCGGQSDAISQAIATRITNLVTYPDMKRAWVAIVELEKSHTAFSAVEFSIKAVEAPSFWNQVGKERRSTVSTITEQIAENAEKIASLLEKHRSLLKYWVGDGIDTANVLRTAALGSGDPTVNSIYPDEVQEYIDDAALGRYFPNMVEVMRAFSMTIRQIVEKEELSLRPTKPQDKNASRTYSIKVLSSYLLVTTQSPNRAIVAATINSVFDDPDSPVDENLVAKLTEEIRV